VLKYQERYRRYPHITFHILKVPKMYMTMTIDITLDLRSSEAIKLSIYTIEKQTWRLMELFF